MLFDASRAVTVNVAAASRRRRWKPRHGKSRGRRDGHHDPRSRASDGSGYRVSDRQGLRTNGFKSDAKRMDAVVGGDERIVGGQYGLQVAGSEMDGAGVTRHDDAVGILGMTVMVPGVLDCTEGDKPAIRKVVAIIPPCTSYAPMSTVPTMRVRPR